MNRRRAHILTYGCQMNVYESAVMERLLRERGYSLVDRPEDAELVILNTCSVRKKPEQKVFAQLGQLAQARKSRPEMRIVVSGCMAQLRGEELRQRFPVDGIFGPRNLAEFRAFLERCERGGEGRVLCTSLASNPFTGTIPAVAPGNPCAFVTIMEGCSNFCAYCIVPYVRGPELSRPVEGILPEIKVLVVEGVREVTLLGQNVNAYGRDIGAQGFSPACGVAGADLKVCATLLPPQGVFFSELLRRVCQVDGLLRVRFTTSHPKDFSPDIVRAVADLPQACEHFHLPIQSGDDEILHRMGRGYTLGDYKALLRKVREMIPDVALSTDVMVGFPGETEERFENTLKAFEEIRFDQAFMFIYTERPKTAASAMPHKVPREVAVQRLRRLSELQNRISKEINEAQVGQVFEVLVEGPSQKDPTLLTGRTRTNKLVHFPGPAELRGQLVQVKAERGHLWGFRGARVDCPRGVCYTSSGGVSRIPD